MNECNVFQVDVSGAYESLPHAKLLDVIRDVLSPVQDEAFTIRRYAKIWMEAFDGLKKSFVNWVHMHAHTLTFVLLYLRGHRLLVSLEISNFLTNPNP